MASINEQNHHLIKCAKYSIKGYPLNGGCPSFESIRDGRGQAFSGKPCRRVHPGEEKLDAVIEWIVFHESQQHSSLQIMHHPRPASAMAGPTPDPTFTNGQVSSVGHPVLFQSPVRPGSAPPTPRGRTTTSGSDSHYDMSIDLAEPYVADRLRTLGDSIKELHFKLAGVVAAKVQAEDLMAAKVCFTPEEEAQLRPTLGESEVDGYARREKVVEHKKKNILNYSYDAIKARVESLGAFPIADIMDNLQQVKVRRVDVNA